MTGRRKSTSGALSGFILSGILVLLISVFTPGEGLSMEKSVDLPEADGVQQDRKKTYDEKFRTGPHQHLACEKCHTSDEEKKTADQFYTVANSTQVCRSCHLEVITHPIGIDILGSSKKGAHSLPLSKEDREGKIECLSCHIIHLPVEGPKLLRGKQSSYVSKRTVLCLHCHRDLFQRKPPHDGQGEKCGFCHMVRPSEDEEKKDSVDLLMQASCNLCHSELADAHYPGSDPFLDVEIRDEAIRSGILPENGQPACTSCHDHHGKRDGKGMLREEYITLCSKSRAINPHWNDYQCLSCHQRQPTKGDVSLLEEGDINAMCNRCHESEYATSDIHPVGISPSDQVRIPDFMPLENGRITCTTCHDSKQQAGCVKKEMIDEVNVLFLRGKQKSRNSFCFLCHYEESYKLLNPHEQVNDRGEIQEETCLFCHSSIPDLKSKGPEKVTFVVQNPDAYCIGCHHGFVRKHPAGIDHLRKPSKKIMETLATSVERIGVELPLYKGKVVCATCHNPHQTGVIKFSAAATGTKRSNKLRLMPGLMQCVGCHWDKR